MPNEQSSLAPFTTAANCAKSNIQANAAKTIYKLVGNKLQKASFIGYYRNLSMMEEETPMPVPMEYKASSSYDACGNIYQDNEKMLDSFYTHEEDVCRLTHKEVQLIQKMQLKSKYRHADSRPEENLSLNKSRSLKMEEDSL